MSDDFVPSIDVDAVFAGLKTVRTAVSESPFVTWSIPLVASPASVDALWAFVGGIDNVRAAMATESDVLADQVTVIALNACWADQIAEDQANATVTDTTTSTTEPPSPSTTVPAAETPPADVTPTQTTTSTTTPGTTVPPGDDP